MASTAARLRSRRVRIVEPGRWKIYDIYETLKVVSPKEKINQSTFIVRDWLGYVIGWFEADATQMPLREEECG